MKAKAKPTNIETDKLEIIKWVAALDDETSIERLKMDYLSGQMDCHRSADFCRKLDERLNLLSLNPRLFRKRRQEKMSVAPC